MNLRVHRICKSEEIRILTSRTIGLIEYRYAEIIIGLSSFSRIPRSQSHLKLLDHYPKILIKFGYFESEGSRYDTLGK